MKRNCSRKRFLILTIPLALILLLAACGDDSGSEPFPTVDPASLPGDPAAGALVYENEGCASCHAVDSDARRTGPSLQKIGGIASSRVSDQSATDYLRTSLLEPNTYIVKNYSGVMPAYDGITPTDLDNLIAFLLTLTG